MDEADLRTLIDPFRSRIGGLIHALRAVLNTTGWIDPDTLPTIASVFNVSVAEVRGVVGFYEDFRDTPPPRSVIRVCQAEACQSLGCRNLTAEIETSFDRVLNEHHQDLEIRAVYCLGLCSIGPAVEVNGQILGRATLDDVIARL